MVRFILLWFFSCTISLSCRQVSKAQKEGCKPHPGFNGEEWLSKYCLQISKLAIDILVVANIPTTTFDITLYNNQNEILEGEFEFLLADGQDISRYSLEVNGDLREGVVVEKSKARVAFERTVRQNIDLGLVEKTKGNNFETHILSPHVLSNRLRMHTPYEFPWMWVYSCFRINEACSIKFAMI